MRKTIAGLGYAKNPSAMEWIHRETHKIMTKQIATILGGILVVAGLVGFAAPGLMGMHLSPVHNVIHLASGALALCFGLAGSLSAAKSFCTLFGLVYGLLGVLGFILAGP